MSVLLVGDVGDIMLMLLVLLVIYGKGAKVAIRQRMFLHKLCSGGAGGSFSCRYITLLHFSLRPFYVLLLI